MMGKLQEILTGEEGRKGEREGDLHRGGGVREEVMSETEVTVM